MQRRLAAILAADLVGYRDIIKLIIARPSLDADGPVRRMA